MKNSWPFLSWSSFFSSLLIYWIFFGNDAIILSSVRQISHVLQIRISFSCFFFHKKKCKNIFFSVNTTDKTEKSEQTKHITVYKMSDWEKTTPSYFYSTLTVQIFHIQMFELLYCAVHTITMTLMNWILINHSAF